MREGRKAIAIVATAMALTFGCFKACENPRTYTIKDGKPVTFGTTTIAVSKDKKSVGFFANDFGVLMVEAPLVKGSKGLLLSEQSPTSYEIKWAAPDSTVVRVKNYLGRLP